MGVRSFLPSSATQMPSRKSNSGCQVRRGLCLQRGSCLSGPHYHSGSDSKPKCARFRFFLRLLQQIKVWVHQSSPRGTKVYVAPRARSKGPGAGACWPCMLHPALRWLYRLYSSLYVGSGMDNGFHLEAQLWQLCFFWSEGCWRCPA